MIYKVLYQKDQIVNPRREWTGNSLAYEKQSPDFKLTTFDSKDN